VFSVGAAPRLYNDDPRIFESSPRVQSGSHTSTVALRVEGGDEKGIQCLGVYLGQPVSGGYKYGDLTLQVGGVSSLRQ
jgi:hypothetical protein